MLKENHGLRIVHGFRPETEILTLDIMQKDILRGTE